MKLLWAEGLLLNIARGEHPLGWSRNRALRAADAVRRFRDLYYPARSGKKSNDSQMERI
jgi:hypothetical protein